MAGGGQTQLADPLMGQNHFTAVRWVLAIAVVLGHIWLLTTGFEPFRIHEWTASYMAVNGFFVLSGLLIAKSLHTRRDMKAYAVSRFLRIYPALVIILAAFVLVFAPVYSAEGGGSLFQPETWQYTYKVLALGDPDSAPAQIFSQNLETDFNGPLWTIRFELAAYILAGIAFMFGAVNGPWRVLSVFLLVQSVYLGAPVFI
ncbi:MAG TPA: acyltransferase, partial [Hyphomonas sp.]|nr:acyltransferase [Hyphomonas sp.]